MRHIDIKESASVSMMRLASEMREKGMHVLNFGIGEPDFTTPSEIIDYAFDSARRGGTHYTPSMGLLELRKEISKKLRERNNIVSSPDNVLVTPTKFAIFLSVMALTEPGDMVMIPDPYYLSYPDIIKLAGAEPLSVPTDDDYELDLDVARRFVTSKTSVFILNTPNNPTGKVYSEKSIRELSDFILENNMYLISDEIYEDIVFEGKHFSPGSIDEMAEKTVTISGFSKGFAMTGWRVGYLNAPDEVIKICNRIQQQTITCAPSISQYGAMKALNSYGSAEKFRDEFRKRRDLVYKLFSEIDGISLRKPEGTFYAFPSFDLDLRSPRFSHLLLQEKQVIVSPGTAFSRSGQNRFRFSFAASQKSITEGIRRIGEFIKERK